MKNKEEEKTRRQKAISSLAAITIGATLGIGTLLIIEKVANYLLKFPIQITIGKQQ